MYVYGLMVDTLLLTAAPPPHDPILHAVYSKETTNFNT